MAPGYAWRCTFCGSSNAAGTGTCVSCSKPAVARGVDVEIAKGKVPRAPVSIIGVAKAHKRALQVLFVAIAVLVLVVVTLEQFRPVNNRETFGFMIIGAGLPWSIAAFVVPYAVISALIIASGVGINAVVAAIVLLWWFRTLGFGE